MTDIKKDINSRFEAAIQAAFGSEIGKVNPLLNVTTQPEFGDYQANLAMSLAKKLGKKPRDIAKELVSELDLKGICDKVEIAGPGFINLYLSDAYVDRQIDLLAADPELGIIQAGNKDTIVVDYSAPNVAKEMHVGHLRSTVIGDAICRVLTRLGHEVIRQNHMGDWGTQFGMLIEYLLDDGWQIESEVSPIHDLEARYQAAKHKFDSDEGFRKRARDRVVALQGGDEESLKVWRYLVEESTRHFSEVYSRLGVLLKESDSCAESFYNPMLEGIVELLEEGDILRKSEGADVVFLEGYRDRDNKPLPLIVRKADGGYLYATTDLAAVRYRTHDLKANRIIYVTDARQSQHFAMIFSAVKLAGWVDTTSSLEHVPFGTVLGANRKPFKTREGGTIKLIDLLDEAEQRAKHVLVSKNPELSESQQEELSRSISISALKYADLSSDRIKDYVFDWDRMLALDGNTAPYLLNAYVRILSIFRKGEVVEESLSSVAIRVRHPTEKSLAMKLFQYSHSVEAVSENLEPHRLCTYIYELSSLFHAFYESCPILKSDIDQETRNSRLALCSLVARVMKDGLGLLGINTVEKM